MNATVPNDFKSSNPDPNATCLSSPMSSTKKKVFLVAAAVFVVAGICLEELAASGAVLLGITPPGLALIGFVLIALAICLCFRVWCAPKNLSREELDEQIKTQSDAIRDLKRIIKRLASSVEGSADYNRLLEGRKHLANAKILLNQLEAERKKSSRRKGSVPHSRDI
jgi:hypothetical protein